MSKQNSTENNSQDLIKSTKTMSSNVQNLSAGDPDPKIIEILSKLIKLKRAETKEVQELKKLFQNVSKSDLLESSKQQDLNPELKKWFNSIEPFIEYDEPLHHKLLYIMYSNWYKNKEIGALPHELSENQFKVEIMKIFESHAGWKVDKTIHTHSYKTKKSGIRYRRRITNPKNVGLDWHRYFECFDRPDFFNKNNPSFDIFTKDIRGWFEIHHI